ncbi:hypothetical protein UFOVP99_12 [uncultured Caudovirales phage]|uniref:DNA-binding protein n=1 Tax=uncultured Caudovirales phage TaxID=2100421 RepID=A0A6J5L4F8_9CAUD|nr:hypothetical protein UFOVP99_12 [uncultured Caudovirales phage]
MQPVEFVTLLNRCGWSAAQVARWYGVASSTGGLWRMGAVRIPEAVAAWLRRSAALLASNPPPPPPPGAGKRGRTYRKAAPASVVSSHA